MSKVYSPTLQYLIDTGKITVEDADAASDAIPTPNLVALTEYLHTILCVHTEDCTFNKEEKWTDPCKEKWLEIGREVAKKHEIGDNDEDAALHKFYKNVFYFTQYCSEHLGYLSIFKMYIDAEIARRGL
jgi:hypothetical protein